MRVVTADLQFNHNGIVMALTDIGKAYLKRLPGVKCSEGKLVGDIEEVYDKALKFGLCCERNF